MIPRALHAALDAASVFGLCVVLVVGWGWFSVAWYRRVQELFADQP